MPDEFCPKANVQDENRIYQKSITTLQKKHNQWKYELLKVVVCIQPFSSATVYNQNTHDTEGTEGLRVVLTKLTNAISSVWQMGLQQICWVGKNSVFLILPLNCFHCLFWQILKSFPLFSVFSGASISLGQTAFYPLPLKTYHFLRSPLLLYPYVYTHIF